MAITVAQLSYGVFQTTFQNPMLVQVMITTSILPLEFAYLLCWCYCYYHVLMIRHSVWLIIGFNEHFGPHYIVLAWTTQKTLKPTVSLLLRVYLLL
jgi:hypothetical protein